MPVPMRAVAAIVVVVGGILAACSMPTVEPTTEAKVRATAEAAATKLAEEIGGRLGDDELLYPFDTSPDDGVDGASRSMGDWTVQQEFDQENNWLVPTCKKVFDTYASTTGDLCRHAGVDLHRPPWESNGARIYPMFAGTIEKLHYTGGYPGDAILISHRFEGQILYSMYGHISGSRDLVEGEEVTTSTLLGTVIYQCGEYDTQGKCTFDNSHLHLEIRDFEDFTVRDTEPPEFPDGSRIFECGCEVGPGYWLSSRGGAAAFGWRDPIDVIAESRD